MAETCGLALPDSNGTLQEVNRQDWPVDPTEKLALGMEGSLSAKTAGHVTTHVTNAIGATLDARASERKDWSALADDFRTLVATQDLVDLAPIQVPHSAEYPQPEF